MRSEERRHNDPQNCEQVRLASDRAFWSLGFFDQVDSTNNLVKAAIAEGADEGTCFVAREQTGAYGRQGRSWSSPAGGLYFSFILDPLNGEIDCGAGTFDRAARANSSDSSQDRALGQSATAKLSIADLPTMSLVLSLAVQEVLSNMVGSPASVADLLAKQSESCALDLHGLIRIKWPNDIVVKLPGGFGKLCGISVEIVQQKLCIGIGINVFRPALPVEDSRSSSSTVLPGEDTHCSSGPDSASASSYVPVYLEDLCDIDSLDQAAVLDDLLNELLESIQRYYEKWLREGIEPFVPHYNALLFNLGEEVVLETISGNTIVSGVVRGVALDGALLLEQQDGEIIAAASGELHTVR